MSKLNFTKGRKADDQLVSDVASSGRLDDEVFASFFSMVFSFLTQSKQAARMVEQMEAFSEEHGINPNALKSIVRSWMTFFRGAQRANLSKLAVREDLMQMGLPDDKSKYVAKQYQTNRVALSRSVFGRTLMVNQLVDMEWRFGVAAGSSEARKSGNTFLQIKMKLNNGGKIEEVYMELTLPQFYTFLQEMERAKATLEALC